MMMHHDSQPLYSRGSNYGLLNQINLLRQAGAVSLQVLMMTPSPGTKMYEQTFTAGLVIASAGGKRAEPYMCDGNYVLASSHARPWRKQLNLLVGYFAFYNPVWLVKALLCRKTRVGLKPAGMQIVGMLGLIQSIRRTAGWALRLMFGRIERLNRPPVSRIPVRSSSRRHRPSRAYGGADPFSAPHGRPPNGWLISRRRCRPSRIFNSCGYRSGDRSTH